MATGFSNLPDELLTQILLNTSTPTFIQLTRTSKKFFDLARENRKVILHHLHSIPGDKTKIKDDTLDNQQLFLLLRQRASNVLTGTNFTANLHEYITRDVRIDPEASSVGGLDADYVRMALCFKDSADIRQYTSHCAIKEKIKQISAPGTKILKLVQWGRFVSVLCCSPPRDDDDFSDASDSDQSGSETEMLDVRPFTPTANARLQRAVKHTKPRGGRLVGILKIDQRYQVIHFDVYTMEDSQIFEIIPPPDMVPRDFAVQSSSLCAILWDKSTLGQRPTEDANVVTYTIDARMDDIVYEQKTVWPKSGKPARNDVDSDDEDVPEDLPERIAFFKEGRRIKMYDAGGIVPYQIFSTSTTQYDQYASTNVISFDGFSVHVDTPFFGTHTTQLDEINQQSYCFQHHLCLGVATLNLSNGATEDQVKVLCILRSHNRYYPDGCEHRVSLSRMTHVSATNSTIVARLWGWEETHSNFSGKDIVAVSPGGTRIAIAMWNKILVYPLNPKVLCDEVVVDSSEDESVKVKKKKKKQKKSWETACTDYYHRPKDGNFLGWKVAEIRPIILDLGGAVAHKMSWSPAKGPVTDTEEPLSIPVKDPDAEEDDVEKDTNVTTESNAGQVMASGAIPQSAVIIDPPAVEDIPEPPPPPQTPQSPTSESAQGIDELDNNQSTVEVVSASQAPAADAPNLPNNEIPQPAAIEIPNDTQPGQVSPLEPQSPVQPTKKKESLQPLSTLGTSAPSSPPPMLSSFSNSLSSNPFSLYGASNTSQPSKPSTRKKEKGPELHSTDATGYTPLEKLEKKFQSSLSLGSSDENATNEQVPSLPPQSTIKTGYTSSQTLPEVITGVSPATIKCLAESAPLLTASTTETINESAQEQTKDDTTVSLPETNLAANKEIDEEEDTATNHSKNPSDATTLPVNVQTDSDESATQAVKHKKRITEDELIILTDRGIQVWNLGARAKGKRKKSHLKLEEGLRGKLPRMKGKAKEMVASDEES